MDAAALDAWRDRPAAQQPGWPDPAAAAAVTREIARIPPLVFAGECDSLKERLAAVARGEAFVLQGGDCAETFAGSTADAIRGKLRTLLQMAVILTYAASVPVVKIGRLAGQFAKPRSSDTETRDGTALPAYRGDAVNGLEFTAEARAPDPQRMLRACHYSAATLNLCRAFTQGGYADLRQVHTWNTDFVAASPAGRRYEALAGEIDRALTFMHASGTNPAEFRTVEFYSSHEALLLEYERAMTRIDSRTGLPYDTSAHFPWIGERTRALDGAHVEFFRHVRNPVGVKLGPSTTPEDALALSGRLQPGQRAGAARPSSPGWARRRSAPACPRSWRRSRPAAPRWPGSAIPCTGTRSRHPAGARRGTWRTSSRRSPASSRSTTRSAPIPGGFTSSSPVTTSPSASAGATASPRPTSPAGTRPRATRG